MSVLGGWEDREEFLRSWIWWRRHFSLIEFNLTFATQELDGFVGKAFSWVCGFGENGESLWWERE